MWFIVLVVVTVTAALLW